MLIPATPLSIDFILEDIDRILLLSVDPGFHSQPLIRQAMEN